MKNNFYRFGLPISIAVHVLLVLLMFFIKITVQAQTPVDDEPIRVVEYAEPIPIDQAVTATPPIVAEDTVLVTPGVPNPQAQGGAGISTTINHHPGPGEKPTVAPTIMTSKNGQTEVPVGKDGGQGTEATGDLGPSGPSYGAGVAGSATPTYPKLALEDGMEGTVIVSVTIGPDGNIEGADVTDSSSHKILDNAALRAAYAWRFTPAMEKGQPISATVQLSFRFKDGAVEGSIKK